MNRRNYRRELDRIIEKNNGRKPTVLLHSCCGPCSSSVLEYLTEYFDVTVLWYNPNLYPKEEFDRRYEAQMQIIERMGLKDTVKIIFAEHRSGEYYEAVRGFEDEIEGGSRCERCFRLRLGETARIAKERGFEYFCSTLTVSRHKNAVLINAVGEDCAKEFEVPWLPSEFKKRGGEERSQQLAQEHHIYQQLYCGCEFSYKKRLEA
ncbi:MAG: epoxyqueuosine reductase QueH [Eubacteriales bacterium]|nr:epoxyqueuosine reductase QueH [Eubacteriales bacterium]